MKHVSPYLRKQTLLKLLSATQPRTATELLGHLNERLGTKYNRRTVVRDIAELSRMHAIIETPGHPAAYKLVKAGDDSGFTKEIFALIDELKNGLRNPAEISQMTRLESLIRDLLKS